MTDVDRNSPNGPQPQGSWLPSPGCLFGVTLLVILASVCFWLGWQAQRQQARLEYFEQLGRSPRTEPAKPVWLHDFVSSTLGEEHAVGFTNFRAVYLGRTQVTNSGLRHVSGLTNLEVLDLNETEVTDAGLEHVRDLTILSSLDLDNTQVTDAGVDELESQLPDCSIWGADGF